ncbi:sensor domain-containing diguanylate cyclase [Propionispora hippei]|uniref:PAS domain S-box-containing protein/diguanylate cyclase (GGDEF) domain-containing protein n=1 Tax=Propionispora hippei DSM 15287 TaxID=1123003 RepID=A0A1M6PA91_9FIRM|nr:sensor domain-containing diguanylate cyclase [Propionispora hippei]SHK04782.1 PAS domain S-box-containing protein/diguanylate cyclase (GGDEF) domain-containing protein [Propionispora hippei DSM 15287]
MTDNLREQQNGLLPEDYATSEKMLAEIVDLTYDCLLLVSVETCGIVYANKACRRLYGYRSEELLGMPLQDIAAKDRNSLEREIQRVIKKYPGSYQCETTHGTKTGRQVPVEIISKLVVIDGKKFLLKHIRNISKQKKLQLEAELLIQKLSNHAYYDQLTGAHNRTYLFSVLLPKLIASQLQAGILLMDINKFKFINDTYGHLAGDYILAEFAHTVEACIRKQDKLIRYGGDEFIVVLMKASYEEAVSSANRIKKTVAAKQFIFQGQQIECTASAGIAAGEFKTEKDLEVWIKQADMALYEEKRQLTEVVGRGSGI